MKTVQQEELDLKVDEVISSVGDFRFEPIKGYPMLNWKGKRAFTSTQYYPAQLKEVHGDEINGWINKIFWGDNLQVMSHLLKEYRGKIDLIYIDPPFDSKADYKKKIHLRGQLITNDQNSFEDKQYTDIWTNDEYLQYMYERLIMLRELLSDTGSIFLHCDWHKSHYLRLILDELFGQANFVSEIIWKRATTHSQKKGFAIIQDSIFHYSKSAAYKWFPQYVPHEEDYLNRYYNNYDNDGRRYTLDNLTAAGDGPPRNFFGEKLYPPTGTHWRFSQEKIDEYCKQGLIVLTANNRPRFKRYLDTLKGKAIGSLWDDIDSVNSQANERENYPTQKPESLLNRIISSTTSEGDLVLDCFMGSGTTQAAAMKLGRRFIGADINLGAIQTTTKRLINASKELSSKRTSSKQLKLSSDDSDQTSVDTLYTGFSVYNVNNYDIFRNPIQAKELLIQALEVQPFPAGSIWDGEKDGRKIKIMPINRIATKADLNEIISNIPWKEYNKSALDAPNRPVDHITLVCMGHEPDLAGTLQMALNNIKIDVEVVDILRDKSNLEFKRDSEAKIEVKKNKLVIKNFYPMNLLQKLSLMKKDVENWRELVDSVMVDFNYDGGVFNPNVVDVPEGDEMVEGEYKIPEGAGTIKVKITDLLSETFEKVIEYGND